MKVRDLAITMLRHASLSEATDVKSMSTDELVKMIRSGEGEGANLKRANLMGATLTRTKLQGADLQIANLKYADLNGANLEGASLWYANLQNANLQGANLQGAVLVRADFSRVNLRSADLRGANLWGADFQDVIYDAKTKWPKGFNPPPSR